MSSVWMLPYTRVAMGYMDFHGIGVVLSIFLWKAQTLMSSLLDTPTDVMSQ